MNPVVEAKLKMVGALSRQDISDILLSIGPRGEKRDEKRQVIQSVCEQRSDGRNPDDHPIWDALDDFPEY